MLNLAPHKAKKRFGQNFLIDDSIIEQILQACDLNQKDHCIEIGPGLGSLTKPLLNKVKQLTVIELDRDLIGLLKLLNYPNLTIINQDALTVDFRRFGSHLKIIGNLPYNISTPLIFHLLEQLDVIDEMIFMLQKEVVERLAAKPGCKAFGRLSLMVQYHCEVEYLFDVPASSFNPQPKVESAMVRLKPHHLYQDLSISHEMLEKVIASAFTMRRKTLANNLKKIISHDELLGIGIDSKLRPEQIPLIDYIKIVNYLSGDKHV